MDKFLLLLKRMVGRVGRLVRLSFEKRLSRRMFLPVALMGFLLAVPSVARAGVKETTIVILGNITEFFVELLGKLLIAVIDILVKVAQYNDFAESAAVNIGWVVSRDLANMLFIVALIVIAFGTIVGWEQYKYNRLLGKLALTAVLVNFSKAITLFLIDFSQVVMLTFVNAFRDVAAGNLTTAFGIRALLTYSESSTSVDISLTETVMVFALAIILLIIALLVTLTLVVVLARRIISLWILIILSPLAFIASVMPGGVGNFNSQFWSRLGKEMFTGPVLAFFLWLTFSIIFLTSGNGVQETATIIDIGASGAVLESNNEVQAVASEIGSSRNIFNFLAAIVLLIHSLSIAKEAGGFAGDFARGVSGKINAAGTRAIRGVTNLTKKTALGTAKAASAPVRGVAARAGYAAADASLKPFQTIPLVGGKIRKARARLNERRDYIDPDSMRYIRSLSNTELAKIGDGTAFTRQGVVERRHATEELIRRNKGHRISEGGMQKYLKAIGYSAQIEHEDPNDKTSPIVGVEENARYREGLEKYFQARWRAPQHYKAIFPGAKAGSAEYQAVNAEFSSDLAKAKKGDFLDMTLEGLQDPRMAKLIYENMRVRMDKSKKFADDMTRDATDPLRYVMLHHGMPFPMKESQRKAHRYYSDYMQRKDLGIENPSFTEDKINELMGYVSQYGTAAAATSYKPEFKPVKDLLDRGELSSDAVQTRLSQLIKYGELTDAEYAAEYGKNPTPKDPEATPLADVSKEQRDKFQQQSNIRERLGVSDDVGADDLKQAAQAMRSGESVAGLNPEAVKAISSRVDQGESHDAIIASLEEYDQKVKSGEYYDQQKFSEEKKIFDQLLKAQEQGIDEISGAKNFAQRLEAQREESEKRGTKAMGTLGSNFSELELDGAGVNLDDVSDERKEEIFTKLEDQYSRQLQQAGELNEGQVQERVKEFGEALRSAEHMALINNERQGYTGMHVLRHERAHPEIEKLSEKDREELFGILPEEEQKRIIDEISTQWNLNDLPDDQKRKRAMEEYFTEGLANYGRSDAVGAELSPDLALEMKVKGVRFRSYTDVEQAAAPLPNVDAQAQSTIRQNEVAQTSAQREIEQALTLFKEKYGIASQLSAGDVSDPLVQRQLMEKYDATQEDIGELVRAQNESENRIRELQQELDDIRNQRRA